MRKHKILWMDDKIKYYEPFITELEKYDMEITKAESVDQAIEIAKQDNFDLFLLDLRMRGGRSGFDALQELEKNNQKTPKCVLSSYLHDESYVENLDHISYAVSVLDKDLPEPGNEAFQIFVDKLKSMLRKPPKLSPKEFEQQFLDKNIDPFKVTFKNYMNLPNRIKQHLRTEARKIAAETIEEEFKEGKIWVMLCGSPKQIIFGAETDSQIPTPEQVIQIALHRDKVPYQFSAPDNVDDLWSASCEGGTAQKWYPTVTFDLAEENEEEHFHFDTGSPATFMSYEELNELQLIDHQAQPTEGNRGTCFYEYISQPLRTRIVDQENKSVCSITLRIRAVKNWLNSPFTALCPSSCSHFNESAKVNCKNRKGLVGRNLYQETNLTITLNGNTNKTKISRRS
jgi:CheY-like chemotaxis protein